MTNSNGKGDEDGRIEDNPNVKGNSYNQFVEEMENTMATSKEYIDFVREQIAQYGEPAERKMFGEYMVYLGGKPVLLVCDNTVFVKKLAETEPVMKEFGAESGFPYEGAKEHFVLDIENRALLDKIIPLLEKITPVPARRKKVKGRE